MNKIISGGIKCDNDACNYRDDSVKTEDYENWLNKPCPNCGENLLTEEDFASFQKVMSLLELMKEFSKEADYESEEDTVMITFSSNGTGAVNMQLDVDPSTAKVEQ